MIDAIQTALLLLIALAVYSLHKRISWLAQRTKVIEMHEDNQNPPPTLTPAQREQLWGPGA